eukprot:scaffold86300_cov15-Tisochrysis_lutea.AAC.1
MGLLLTPLLYKSEFLACPVAPLCHFSLYKPTKEVFAFPGSCMIWNNAEQYSVSTRIQGKRASVKTFDCAGCPSSALSTSSALHPVSPAHESRGPALDQTGYADALDLTATLVSSTPLPAKTLRSDQQSLSPTHSPSFKPPLQSIAFPGWHVSPAPTPEALIGI